MHSEKSIFCHSISMVRKNIKSYALLSVTIILSFTLLLGYLLFTDSEIYHRYKDLFALDRCIVTARMDSYSQARVAFEKTNEIGNTNSMIHSHIFASFSTYATDISAEGITGSFSGMSVILIPQHAWGIFTGISQLKPETILWLDGKDHPDVSLGADGMLLCEDIFYALGLDELEIPYYTLRFNGDSADSTFLVTLRVVGLLQDEIHLKQGRKEGVFDSEANEHYHPRAVASMDSFDGMMLPQQTLRNQSYKLVTYTDSPEEVCQLIESMGCYANSVDAQQKEAMKQIQIEKGNKAIISCAMLLLLGINLYSSFTNALNDRKFEIGVKRAIGASAWSIVRQFLYESVLVMLINILISIFLTTAGAIVYKYIYSCSPKEWFEPWEWTVYISPHSVAMFAVCAVALTIAFSLIFAYKSTRVEIIRYLKAE